MRERVLLPPCVPQQCGKDFRYSLRKPSPNYPHGKSKKPRIVPAFTIQGNNILFLVTIGERKCSEETDLPWNQKFEDIVTSRYQTGRWVRVVVSPLPLEGRRPVC